MISSEVQRTLVKSPPELWAELSDPDALARHLGELGEIRIVRTEPESTVEWAAENTTGTVKIKPSGWGTRVTLSITRETIDAAATIEDEARAAPEPEPAAAPKSACAAQELESVAPEPDSAAPEPEHPAATIGESESGSPNVEPTQRRGFFARLFRRRKPSLPAQETFALEHPYTAVPPVDIAAELKAAEEAGTEAATGTKSAGTDDGAKNEMSLMQNQQADSGAAASAAADEEAVTAMLTAVLDRLGAAHHRPFSRS